MALSWNEIRSRAFAFSQRWEHESAEDAEATGSFDAVASRLLPSEAKPKRKKN